MKSSAKFLLTFSVLAAIITGAFLPASDTVALLNKAVNEVSYREDGKGWVNAKAGIQLKDKDVIRTGARSLALVSFLDGSLIRVREKSELTIYGVKESGKLDKNVYIDKGLVNFEVQKQNGEEFKFTTPTMVASIRGTNGFVEVNDNGAMMSLENGSVAIESQVGAKETGMLTAGNSVFIGSDGRVVITPNSAETNKKIKDSEKVNTKTLRLKTEKGTIEIEYLNDDTE